MVRDPSTDPSIPQDVRERYVDAWVAHKATHRGMLWSSEPEAMMRQFLVADELTTMPDGVTILDAGCGYGQLATVLDATVRTDRDMRLQHGRATIKHYTGLDMNPLAIMHAKEQAPKFGFEAEFVAESLDDWHELCNMTSPTDKYSLVAAVGLLAWYPAELARNMLGQLWDMTDMRLVFSINTATQSLHIRDWLGIFDAFGIEHYVVRHDTGIRGETFFICKRFKD